MWKYAALLSYEGTYYCGWQKQKGSGAAGLPSIQATIEQAIGQITKEELSIVGSGRTDAGVHAVGQVAHFILRNKEWDPFILLRGLNGKLPDSIRVLAIVTVPLEFHAQRSAEKKQYSYYFQQGPCHISHLLPYSRWIRKRLDLKAISEALSYLQGEHDFKAFQASGSKPGSTVRKILEADVSLQPVVFPSIGFSANLEESHQVALVRIRVLGTGFLKQMVRGIAGTMLQIGEGRRAPSCISEILESRSRDAVGPTAPARALWLEKVWYPPHFGLHW
ncbi:MAG: tRNA pseudouridine(38-40) synthase TruA [Bdellovibrionia bacterium]